MTNHSVLIANHDAAAANRIATSLRSVGYAVTSASTSDEAIRLATKTRPALLIVNPVMPGLSGFEAAGHIARQVDCKVLFLTDLAGDADFADVLSGMTRNGIHCAALPADVPIADLIGFVRADVGPGSMLAGVKKDEPHMDSIPPARPLAGTGDSPAEQSSAPAAFFDAARNTEPYAPLFAIANSNLYQNNALRLTGLQVGTTAREIRRAYQEFSLNKELGRAWVPVSFITHIVDPSNDEREVAFAQIGDPEERLLQEFFWFWPEGDADDVFAAVQAKDLDRAVKEWRRRSTAGDPKGIASHNLAVFNHLMALQVERSKPFGQSFGTPDFWKNAFHYWHHVVGNSRFWDCFIWHIQDVHDPRLTTDLAEKIWASLPEAILYVNAADAVRAAEAGDFAEAGRQRQLMYGSGLGEENADKALNRALTPLLQHLTLLCSQAKSQVETDPSRGIEVVRALDGAESPLLKTLNCLVGANDPRRRAAHDEVASAIRICLIDYVNKTKAWSVALPLFENCLALAQDPELEGRLRDEIVVLQRNLDLQQRAQPPGAPAPAAPRSAPPNTGPNRQSPTTAEQVGFMIGRKWQRTPLFEKVVLVFSACVVIVALSLISSGSNSGTTPIAPPVPGDSSGPDLPLTPASGSSSGSPAPTQSSTESPPSANNDSELEAVKTEIEESKAKLRSLAEEIQSISSEMNEHTASIDSDRSTLERMDNAGIDLDQEQYEQIKRRHNKSVAAYNGDAERHNSLLRDYRALLAETNDKVDKYNSMVKAR